MRVKLTSSKYRSIKGYCEINFYGESFPINKSGELEEVTYQAFLYGLEKDKRNSFKQWYIVEVDKSSL